MKLATEIIANVNLNNHALLYRCRWSTEDARIIVPQLIQVLSSSDRLLVDEALRALIRIGTPAVDSAKDIAFLINSPHWITRSLAVMALGSVAHKVKELCVGPIVSSLKYEDCRQNALRILAFQKHNAKDALSEVILCYDDSNQRTRKLAVTAAIAIDRESKLTQNLIVRALNDKRKEVRIAAKKAEK